MRKGFFFLILLVFFASAAAADLTLSYFRLGDKIVPNNIEAGSNPNVTLQYENKTGSDVVVNNIEIHLYYDPTLISAVASIQNKTNLEVAESVYYAGKITYKLSTSFKGLRVAAGATADIAIINFFVKATPARTGPGISLFGWQQFSTLSSLLSQTALYAALEPISINIDKRFITTLIRSKITDINNLDVTGTLRTLRTVNLTPKKPPIFGGVSKVYCADIQNVPNTGNALWVLWNPATDDWPPVRYTVHRKSKNDLDWIVVADTAENFYFDQNLTDNTFYEYKVYATDAGGSVNQSQVAIGDKPHDYKSPGDIQNLSAIFQDGAVVINWDPPADEDWAGTMIVRDPQGFWVPEGASGDNNGKTYTVGSEPWGEGKGTVVSVDEYGGTSFEDYNIELGKTYTYKVFAVDETWSGQGRNYSTGKTIGIQAGEGAAGVLATADWVIPIDFKEGINYISVPHIGAMLDGEENIIGNLKQFVDEINRQAGENTVLSIGYWDREAQEAKGIRIDYSAANIYVPIKGITAEEPVVPGMACVISVTTSFQYVHNLSFAQYE